VRGAGRACKVGCRLAGIAACLGGELVKKDL